MSGTTGMPRSAKIASASIVVGPFAPSTISLARRDDEEVALELEQLLVRDPQTAVIPLERAMLGDVRVQLGHLETRRRVGAPGDVGHRDHRRAVVVELRHRDAADVAEALDDA